MKATLVSTQNDETVALARLPVVLGRSPEAAIQLRDRFASQFHCEISTRDGALFVRDLGSKHGTLINGRLVTESPLSAGDELSVGLTTFVVHCEQPAELQLATPTLEDDRSRAF